MTSHLDFKRPSKPRNTWRWLPFFHNKGHRHEELIRWYGIRQDIEPLAPELYAPLKLCPPAQVRVVLFAQEPYRVYGPGVNDGIPYSVKYGAKRIPTPARNLMAEYQDDLGFREPRWPDLKPWCENGVLMLYNSWIVRQGDYKALRYHYDSEPLTYDIFRRVNEFNPGCVFMFLGTGSKKWLPHVDTKKHAIIQTAGPTDGGQQLMADVPPFRGSHVFSEASKLLGASKDMWRLP